MISKNKLISPKRLPNFLQYFGLHFKKKLQIGGFFNPQKIWGLNKLGLFGFELALFFRRLKA